MKDDLGGKITKKFAGLTAKTYSYLIDDGSEDKKAKDTNRYAINKIKFDEYKTCLEVKRQSSKDNKKFIKSYKLRLKTQQRFKSERHNVFTEEINRTALSSNDDTKMQSIDSTKTFAY